MFSSIVGKGGMEQLFENKELNVSVRTVRRGEEVLFYAKDVAESLGYKKPRNAVQRSSEGGCSKRYFHQSVKRGHMSYQDRSLSVGNS